MQLWVYLYCIGFHQMLCRFEVAFALYALNLSQQTGKELAKGLVVIYLDVVLAISLCYLYDTIGMLITPVGYQCTIAHVGFLYVVSKLNANILGHHAIHDVGVVIRLISLFIRRQAQFHEFLVSYIV